MSNKIFSASPASGLNCGKEKTKIIKMRHCRMVSEPVEGQHDNLITAHTHNSNLVTGYILLCSKLYIFNIIIFELIDNVFPGEASPSHKKI